ncbi:nucleoside diphosphate-linked moiety X motif 8-like [Bradysia coprophila]|uniref:nucleoside diphosphate-linked moiety X motif 8-like n=1 Tax=Bradysia coprophila TaxID=38358 RepID=UPI00187D9496|nr:nucleoside diphosphate-linked moiety X motif 8-like [Bradysia coprophila]XP_037048167.1 nucleoside diphosphate-linked moiety X motif 8-like [Bradysia coprophila]
MTATTNTFDWNETFSVANKARTIEYCRLDRENGHYAFPTDESDFKRAAVLVPLCYDVLGRPSILYNLRSLNLSRHSGEISFPGGIMEPDDGGSPIITALRETEEELGLKRDYVEVWERLRDIQTITTSMVVTPVIGFVSGLKQLDPAKMKINPDEVDQAFTVTLEHLCDSNNWADMERLNIAFPVYKNLNFRSSSPTVDLWGLTAIITHLTLKALLPTVYKRRVLFLEEFAGKKNSQL